MPEAHPPLAPAPPASLRVGEAEVISHYYGADAVIRNWGARPDESFASRGNEPRKAGVGIRYDCLGALFTRIDRKQIDLIVTKRGWPPSGSAKIAYRQGVVL
jgi:hypothetical protein